MSNHHAYARTMLHVVKLCDAVVVDMPPSRREEEDNKRAYTAKEARRRKLAPPGAEKLPFYVTAQGTHRK
jgi:hypothetical protein